MTTGCWNYAETIHQPKNNMSMNPYLKLVGHLRIPALTILMAAACMGAKVEYVGSEGVEAERKIFSWRNPADPKEMDSDGDNIYGSLGYLLFATAADEPDAKLQSYSETRDPLSSDGNSGGGSFTTLIAMPPSFILKSLQQNRVFAYNYAKADDPQSSDAPPIILGMAGVANLAKGATAEVLSISFTEDRADFRLGIMARSASDADGIDVIALAAGDSSAEATASGAGGKLMIYFFDVTEIKKDDVVTLAIGKDASAAGQSNALYYGIIIDEVSR